MSERAEAQDVLELEGAIEDVLPAEDGLWTFGRNAECTWELGPGDLGISRLQGGFERRRGEWWIRNLSATRPISVVLDTGLGETIAVESSRVVDRRSLTVIVTGEVHRHPIFVRRPIVSMTSVRTGPGRLTDGVATTIPPITPRERWALVAMVEGYLAPPPRHDPRPRSYQQVADRLGLPRSTVMKRIENVRKKLDAAGVPGMAADDSRAALAEHLLASRTISGEDLAALARAIVDGHVG
jgi:hypothetical protein